MRPINYLCTALISPIFALALQPLCPPNTCYAGELAVVGFDVPAVSVAEPVHPSYVQKPTSGGKLVRLRFPVSAFLSPEFTGTVDEYMVEVASPQQTFRVVDIWPRNEMVSNIDGTIAVDTTKRQQAEASFTATAAFEPIARGSANAKYQNESNVKERFARKPPMQALTSSGTTQRGYGCFFRFRPGPANQLEGAKDIAILAEVPLNWRADALLVSMRATGKPSGYSRSRQLGSARLWMTVHVAGDSPAAFQAQRFVREERALRSLALSARDEIKREALPTMWHKMGAALEIVEPRIPQDYLANVIFGPSGQYLEGNAHRLPIEVRVAILDYWEQRERLYALAYGG